jgi:sugar phosphate isomerase/epimerase
VPVIPAVVGDAELYRSYDRRWSGVPGLGRLGGLRRLAAEKPAEPAAVAERLARLLRWHYGAALKPGHKRLRALRATCELALALGIRPVVYVTPVNAEAALRHCGVDLARRMGENVDVVRRELPAAVRFADFHAFLPESAFFHDNLSTEHLADVGRRQLAGAIVRLLGDRGR